MCCHSLGAHDSCARAHCSLRTSGPGPLEVGQTRILGASTEAGKENARTRHSSLVQQLLCTPYTVALRNFYRTSSEWKASRIDL